MFLPGERPGTVGIPSWKSSIFIAWDGKAGPDHSLVLTWEAGPAPIAALTTTRGVLPMRETRGRGVGLGACRPVGGCIRAHEYQGTCLCHVVLEWASGEPRVCG